MNTSALHEHANAANSTITDEVLSRAKSELDTTFNPSLGCVVSTIMIIVYAVVSSTIFLIPLVVYWYLRMRARQKEKQPIWNLLKQFLPRSRLIMGYPIMVTSHLRRKTSEPGTGLILVCLDPDVTIDQIGTIMEAFETPQDSLPLADRQQLENLLSDVDFNYRRWRAIPKSLAGDKRIYAIDLALFPQLLPAGSVTDEMPFIPLLIDPVEHGLAIQVPPWQINPRPVSPDEQNAYISSICMLLEFEAKYYLQISM